MSAAELNARFSWLVQSDDPDRKIHHDWRVSQVALSGPASQLLKADANRVAVRFMNFGTGRAFIGPTGNVTSGTGWPLVENGGAIGFDLINDVDVVMHDFWAIASAATTIAVLEIFVV